MTIKLASMQNYKFYKNIKGLEINNIKDNLNSRLIIVDESHTEPYRTIFNNKLIKQSQNRIMIVPRYVYSITSKNINNPYLSTAFSLKSANIISTIFYSLNPNISKPNTPYTINITPQIDVIKSTPNLNYNKERSFLLESLSSWIPKNTDNRVSIYLVICDDLKDAIKILKSNNNTTYINNNSLFLQAYLTPLIHSKINGLDSIPHPELYHNSIVLLTNHSMSFIFPIFNSFLEFDPYRTDSEILNAIAKVSRALDNDKDIHTDDVLVADDTNYNNEYEINSVDKNKKAKLKSDLSDDSARKVISYQSEFITYTGKKTTFGEMIENTPPSVELEDIVIPNAVFTNKEIGNPKTESIAKTYKESGQYDRDIALALHSIANDPDLQYMITGMERVDSSDSLSIKETVSIHFKDAKGKSGVMHIDLPKLTKDGYLYISGVRWHITKQIIAKPIIKTKPDEVLITTAYNKAIIKRFGSRNVTPTAASFRQLCTWISKNSPNKFKVEIGRSITNERIDESIEMEDLAKTYKAVHTPSFKIFFEYKMIDRYIDKVEWLGDLENKYIIIGGANDKSFVIGYDDDGSLCKIYQDKTIEKTNIDSLIENELINNGYKPAVKKTYGGRKYSYARVKIFSVECPVAIIAGYSLGLLNMIASTGAEIVDKEHFASRYTDDKDYIQFKDGYVIWDIDDASTNLLLNGLKEMDTVMYPIKDFDSGGLAWIDYLGNKVNTGYAKGLKNFLVSFIDPISKEFLAEDNLPTEFDKLLIYGVKLLGSNKTLDANDVTQYRIRSTELIPALLYKLLQKEIERVRATRDSASPQKLNFPKNEVIKQLLNSSNVEEAPELNPLLETEQRAKLSWTGAVGGFGDSQSVNKKMRQFHPTMRGLVGYSSPDSGEIGVKRTMSYAASVKDTKGRIDVDSEKNLATQLYSTVELSSPYTALHADPSRIGMQTKQASHTMPIKRHTAPMIGCGVDRTISHTTGNTFSYKAYNSGVVDFINTQQNLIKLKYDDGSVGYIDTAPRSTKNSGGGFYINTQLSPASYMKVGYKFSKNEVLAYDKSFFDEHSEGGVVYKSGILVRTMFMAADQTFEDSLIVSRRLTRDTIASVIMSRSVSLNAKSNIQKIVKIGDEVKADTPLVIFEQNSDEGDVNKLLDRLGSEYQLEIAELMKNTAKAKYTGKITEMRIYYNKPIAEFSPSIQNFLTSEIKRVNARKSLIVDNPSDDPIRLYPPEYVERDKVNGEEIDGILIFFFIQIEDEAMPGDKFVSASPLKGIIARVLEDGEEPLDEYGRKIDYIISPLSAVSRMVNDAFLSLWTNAILVELKRQVLAKAGLEFPEL